MKYLFSTLQRCGVIALVLFTPLFANIENSVVLISCTSQAYRMDVPWKKAAITRGTGTGFAIKGNQIMTNAHVVSNATYIEIMLVGDDQKYVARVKHIAHDCDLATLEVDDQNLFKHLKPLELGPLPKTNSTVTTYGYPIGGKNVSVTKGIVSRIQQWTYSHSGSDAHLVIQTDAAINPGNSGGPAIQNGKVVGVAFQGLTQADNIGYLIPSTVVQHFIDDFADGSVDGFGELGIQYRNDLQNPMVRDILATPKNENGVVITRVYPNMPAHNTLKPMDVIMKIGDYNISDDGNVEMDGLLIGFPEVMERVQVGKKITFKIWRDKKAISLTLAMKKWDLIIPHAHPYDVIPKYYIYSGLCFTPLSRGYLSTLGGWRKAPLSVRYLYMEAFADEELVKYEEFPVLGLRLPDDVNAGCDDYVAHIVKSVNGKTVKSMSDLKTHVEESNSKYISFEFHGKKIPFVLSRSAAETKHATILSKYHIPVGERL